MLNNQLPDYLCELITQTVSGNTRYDLRNNSEIQGIYCWTHLYANSFLPDTISLWNALPNSKETHSLSGFMKLHPKRENNIYFDLSYGSRFSQIIHSRLRLGCSDLNADMFNRHIINSPRCSCGYGSETALHFFFVCDNYLQLRPNMYFYSAGYNLDTVMNGKQELSSIENQKILESVHNYIFSTQRFRFSLNK